MKKFILDGIEGKKYIIQLPTDDPQVVIDFKERFDKSMKAGYSSILVSREVKIFEVKKGRKLKNHDNKSKLTGGKKWKRNLKRWMTIWKLS